MTTPEPDDDALARELAPQFGPPLAWIADQQRRIAAALRAARAAGADEENRACERLALAARNAARDDGDRVAADNINDLALCIRRRRKP